MIGALSSPVPIMVHPSQVLSPYAARNVPTRITVVRKGVVRTYEVRPWVAVSALGVVGLLMIAYIAATAYLVGRDDLLGAAISRQVAMQYAYEERIAALRSEIDRVTSRHIVQTTGVEERLSILLERQAAVQRRQSELDAVIDSALASGVQDARVEQSAPPPVTSGQEPARLAYADTPPAVDHMITGALLGGTASAGSHLGQTKMRARLQEVEASIDDVRGRQAAALDALSTAAQDEADRISSALETVGIEVRGGEQPQGGPYVPAAGLHFVERIALLRNTLDDIARFHGFAAQLPLLSPVPSRRASSAFGYRVDPFLRRPAFHAGLDLVAPEGAEVRATADGSVIFAGLNGGYGKMVEVRHAKGVTTRYGHLSAILVSPGEKVAAGDIIGRVGSTGRSTGPHLHYETRRAGTALDPAVFLAAGRALRAGGS